jgi:hypothetical protein
MQFCEVLLGVIGGVVIYRFNWPNVVRWPLILVVVSIGLIAAFFPIADRPLSHWIRVYFQLLFKPTKFYWRKKMVVPAYFDFALSDQHKAFLEQTTTFNALPVKSHRALAYFDTITRSREKNEDGLEIFNNTNLSKVTNSIIEETAQGTPVSKKDAAKEVEKVVYMPNLKTEQAERTRQMTAPNQKTLNEYLDHVQQNMLNNKIEINPTGMADAPEAVDKKRKKKVKWPGK